MPRTQLETTWGYRWTGVGLRLGWHTGIPGGAIAIGDGAVRRPFGATMLASVGVTIGPHYPEPRWFWTLEFRAAGVVSAVHTEWQSCAPPTTWPVRPRVCEGAVEDEHRHTAIGTIVFRVRGRVVRDIDVLAAVGVQNHPRLSPNQWFEQDLVPGPVLAILAFGMARIELVGDRARRGAVAAPDRRRRLRTALADGHPPHTAPPSDQRSSERRVNALA